MNGDLAPSLFKALNGAGGNSQKLAHFFLDLPKLIPDELEFLFFIHSHEYSDSVIFSKNFS